MTSICGRTARLQGLFATLACFALNSVLPPCQSDMADSLKAFPKVARYGIRAGMYALVYSNTKLHSACITENTHSDANVATLRYPEHRLGQFAARQVQCIFRPRDIGQYSRSLVAEQRSEER